MAAADFVRGHPVLRPLLAPACRLRAYGRALAAPTSGSASPAHGCCCTRTLLPSRPARSRRRAALERASVALPDPPPEPRLVSVVAPLGTYVAPAPSHVTTEPVRDSVDAAGALVCFLGPTAQPLDDALAGAPHRSHPRRCRRGDAAARPERARAGGRHRARTSSSRRWVTRSGSRTTRRSCAPAPRRVAGALTEIETVDAGAGACFVVDRTALVAAGGVDEELSPDAGIVDLSVRLRARRRTSCCGAGRDRRRPSRGASRAELTKPFATRPTDWYEAVACRGPLLVRSVRSPQLPRIAITTAVPSAKVAPRWGDWHFGADLARALRRRGHEVRLQTADQADTLAGRACDIHLVLHGLANVARTEGQGHVIWVISHPETISTSEADAADLVFVASEQFAANTAARMRTPVEVLLQATDPRRFHPQPVDPRFAHPVVVVAKTRTVMRPIVADAIAAGIRPAIYGSGWDEFVDPSLVVAPTTWPTRTYRSSTRRPVWCSTTTGRPCASTGSSRTGSSTCWRAGRR